MRFWEGVVPYGTALFRLCEKTDLHIKHHSLGKTGFDKPRGYGGRAPVNLLDYQKLRFIENLILSIINPFGKVYHGINVFLKGHRIPAVIIKADVLLVSQTVIMRHIEIREDINGSDPFMLRVKFLAQFIPGTNGFSL